MRTSLAAGAALAAIGAGAGGVLQACGGDGAGQAGAGEWIRSVPGERAEVWAVGDADDPDAAAVARLIAKARPDRLLYLGDVYQSGTAAEFEDWAREFGRFAELTAPTPGNHDWPHASDGYKLYWKNVTGQTPSNEYAFRAGGWEILSMNSEIRRRDAGLDWLRRRVRHGGTCRIAFWHRPRYSAGTHGDDELAELRWQALRGRARIVLSGHDHDMQRMRPRDGIVQFVSGAGGRRHYPVNEDDPRLAFSNDSDYGALRLSLSPGRARWQFVAVGGRVLDSGSLSCHK